jgi:hypothetical protein
MTDKKPGINKKPVTPEELKADIESHPERGTIAGVPIVRFDQDEIRGKIAKELHREFLIWAGLHGKTKADAIEYAITYLLNSPGVQESIQRRLQEKAELHNSTVTEVRNAILGYFKKLARQSRAKLTGVEVAEVDDRLEEAIGRTQIVDSMPVETIDYGLRDDGRS